MVSVRSFGRLSDLSWGCRKWIQISQIYGRNKLSGSSHESGTSKARVWLAVTIKRKKIRMREKTILLLLYGKGMMSKVDFQPHESPGTLYPSLHPSNRFHIYHIRRTSMPIQYTGLVANRHTASPNMVHMKPIWAGYAGLERCRWLLGLEIDFTHHTFAIRYQKNSFSPPTKFFPFLVTASQVRSHEVPHSCELRGRAKGDLLDLRARALFQKGKPIGAAR